MEGRMEWSRREGPPVGNTCADSLSSPGITRPGGVHFLHLEGAHFGTQREPFPATLAI